MKSVEDSKKKLTKGSNFEKEPKNVDNLLIDLGLLTGILGKSASTEN